MLPAHEGPLPLLPAQPLQAGAQAYERISVPFSFPPQMHRPSAPQQVYAEQHNHYNTLCCRATEWRIGRGADHFEMRRINHDRDHPPNPMRQPTIWICWVPGSVPGNGQGICLGGGQRRGGDHRSDNLSQLPTYPDGNMMEL